MITGSLIARAKPREATVRAVITRADGRVEDLGAIAYYHRNPIRRVLWALSQALRRRKI